MPLSALDDRPTPVCSTARPHFSRGSNPCSVAPCAPTCPAVNLNRRRTESPIFSILLISLILFLPLGVTASAKDAVPIYAKAQVPLAPLQTAGPLRDYPAESLTIIDIASGNKRRTKGRWRMERVLGVSDSLQELTALCATRQGVQLRTVSYDARLKKETTLPGLRFWKMDDLELVTLSPDGNRIAYSDRADKCIHAVDLSTGARTTVMDNVPWNLAEMYWIQPKLLVLVIWYDLTQSNPLGNSIVTLDIADKRTELVCRGKDLHPRDTITALSPDRTSLLLHEGFRKRKLRSCPQIVDLQSKAVRALVPASDDCVYLTACWSLDGTKAAYVEGKIARMPDLKPEERERLWEEYSKLLRKHVHTRGERQRIDVLETELSGSRDRMESAIWIQSITTGQRERVYAFPDSVTPYGITFLDDSHLIMQRMIAVGGRERFDLMMVDTDTGSTKVVSKGHFIGSIVPILGGKKVVCLSDEQK